METNNKSLLPDGPTTVVEPGPVAQVASVIAEGEKRARRKPKPYEQLKTSTAVLKQRKAERKAAKADKKAGVVKPIAKKAKASKPAGKMSKAALKVAKRKAEVKKAQTGKSGSKSGICSFCGKPLSRHTSVEAGMGDVCAQRKAMLKGKSLEDHYAGITVYDDPGKDYIPFQKAKALAQAKGVSGYRLIIAMGGERMIRKPLNEHFKIIIYKGTRYLPKSFLSHLKDLQPK